MSSTPDSKRVAQFLKESKDTVILAGAGISFEAGIPMSNGVVERLKTKYPEKIPRDCSVEYEEAWRRALPGDENRNERRVEMEHLIAGTRPTEEHHFIAKLVEEGYADGVLTTNFDHLLEFAFNVSCSHNHRVYQYDTQVTEADVESELPKLFKLHGDFLYDDLANLDEEMKQRVATNMYNEVVKYLDGKSLVVIGYSGRDDSVMSLLQQCAASKNGLDGGLFWLFHGENNELDSSQKINRFANVLEENGKTATSANGVSAGEFLEDVLNELSVKQPEMPPFGVDPERRNVLNSYNIHYGLARHQPPSIEITAERETLTDELGELLTPPGVYEIHVEPSSKWYSVLNAVVESSESDWMWYDKRYRNDDPSTELYQRLSEAIDRLGVSTKFEGSNRRAIEKGFEAGLAVVLPNISADYSNAFDTEFQRLASIQTAVRKGKVIAVSVDPELEDLEHSVEVWEMEWSEMPFPGDMMLFTSRELQPPTKITVPGDAQQTRGDLHEVEDNVSREQWELLTLFSCLRSGEPATSILPIVESDGADVASLIERGLLEKGGIHSYRHVPPYLEEPVRSSMTGEELQRVRRELGERFESLAEEGPTTRRFHYLLESEYHYYEADDLARGLNVLLEADDMLLDIDRYNELHTTLNRYFEWLSADDSYLAQFNDCGAMSMVENYILSKFKQDGKKTVPFVYADVRAKLDAKFGQGWSTALDAILKSSIEPPEVALDALHSALNVNGHSDELRQNLYSELGLTHISLAEKPMSNTEDHLIKAIAAFEMVEELARHMPSERLLGVSLDNQAATWLSLGEHQRSLQLSKRALEQLILQQSMNRDRGAIYGNLFLSALAQAFNDIETDGESLEQAEGYFFESNLNFSNSGDLQGIYRNIGNIALTLLRSTQWPDHTDSRLPSITDLCEVSQNLWLQNPNATLEQHDRVRRVCETTILAEGDDDMIREWLDLSKRYVKECYARDGPTFGIVSRFYTILRLLEANGWDQGLQQIGDRITPVSQWEQDILVWYVELLASTPTEELTEALVEWPFPQQSLVEIQKVAYSITTQGLDFQ